MKKIKQTQLMLLAIFFGILLASCGGNNTENVNNKSDSNTEEEKVVVDNTPRELTKEDKIQLIKDEFSKIEGNISNYEFKEATYEGAKGDEEFQYYVYLEWDAYFSDGKLVKLIEESGDEGYWGKTSYYYDKDENLFFVFNELEYDGEPVEEARIYVNDGVIIDALKKVGEDEDGESFKKAKNKTYEEVLSGDLKDMFFNWEKNAKEGFLENVVN